MLNQILQTIGHNPTTTTQTRTTYKSPFNPTERTASFCVFPNSMGEWKNFKDYASGAGGDIYTFLMQYYHIGFTQAKQKLQELTGEDYQEHSQPTLGQAPLSSINQPKRDNYKIIKTSTLKNKALIDYLKSRRISYEIAKHYVSEIYYEINSKKYFGISFANNRGGLEIRNKYFKGSFGTKDIAFIAPLKKATKIKIFEGFMDFLSYVEMHKNAHFSDYIVLNSVSLLDKAIEAIQGKYEQIELYLDNDKAGDEATKKFIKNNSRSKVIDKRKYYKNSKDLNEFLLKDDKIK